MAAPIFTSAINKFGRTVFRKAGRFISKEVYQAGSLRSIVGPVQRSLRNKQKPNVAKLLMDTIGPPIGGGNWVSRVRKSSERFTEMLGDNNELG